MDASALDYLAMLGDWSARASYRDAPGRALYTRPALFYILLNIAASGAALALRAWRKAQRKHEFI